jgi:3-deoxy-D-manno-octulosonate 8-phosphate phosphatase KdsC-like HAD superfamily phosphatase
LSSTAADDRAVDEETVIIGSKDAAALIGVLANIEVSVRVGDVSPHAVEHLHQRLRRDMGSDAAASVEDMLLTLNQRLRRALGEPT